MDLIYIWYTLISCPREILIHLHITETLRQRSNLHQIRSGNPKKPEGCHCQQPIQWCFSVSKCLRFDMIESDRVIETYDQQCPASIAPDLLYEILKHAYVKSLMENQHLRKRLGSLCKWTLSIFLELYRSMCYRFVGSNRSFLYSIHNEGCKASAEIIHEFRLIWLKTNDNYN